MNDGRLDPDYAAVMRGIQADGDRILGDALADAEAQRVAHGNIRRFEVRQARRRTIRRLGRLAGALLVVAALLTLVWLFVAALSPDL